MGPRHEKCVFDVTDLVRHKPGCKSREDGYRLEISGFRKYREVLSIYISKSRFSHDAAQ